MKRSALIALLVGLAAPGVASAQNSGGGVRYTLSIDARGETPTAMFLDRPNAAPQRLTATDGTFTGTVLGPARVTSAELRARYADGTEESLAIRLVPQAPTIPLSFFRTAPAACVQRTVAPLEHRSMQLRANLEAYFKARDLARDRATTPCGSTMRKRVVRAWFDRSYALAVQTQHIAFDRDAADRLRRIDPSSRAYVERSLAQIEGRQLALTYELQSWAQAQGDLRLALEVNTELRQQVAATPARSAGAELQGLDTGRLMADAAYLRSLSADVDRSPAAGAAATASPRPH